jgi:hypothetical protein
MQYHPAEMTTTAPPKTSWLWICLGIIVSAEITARSIDLFFALIGVPEPPQYSAILFSVASLFGLLVGVPLWQLLVVKPRCVTIRRGALWGVVSGLVVHPLWWIILWPIYTTTSYTSCVCMIQPLPGSAPLGFPPLWHAGLGELLLIIIVSLVVVGWITVIGCAVTGMLLAVFQQWQTRQYLRQRPLPKE